MRSKLMVFSGNSHLGLAHGLCAHLGLGIGESRREKFSNENLLVQILENVREADVFVVQTATSPLHEHIFELFLFLDALKGASATRVTAVLPYFPYVRSDKKDEPRISIAARLMADLLQTSGADRILTMDLHAPQVQGFFRMPVDQLQAAPFLCDYLKRTCDLSNSVVVAGDTGEAKDLGRFANRLDLPMAIIDKRRDASGHVVPANLIGSVKGKLAIIVDDEIASGDTVAVAAEYLLEHGATEVKACATHGVFGPETHGRLATSAVAEVIVTNTVPVPEGPASHKITVLPINKIFARAVQRIHDGNSVSALFN